MMHIHFIKPKEIEKLEEIFAFLTPQGWMIPVWLMHLKESSQ